MSSAERLQMTTEAGASWGFLIVEDEPIVASALSSFFRRYGRCSVVESVAEGVRLAPGSWSGIVVDVNLPDGDGLDVVVEARRAVADVPVLVLSGSLDNRAINRAAVLGARVLSKPCGQRELTTFVQDLRASDDDPVRDALSRARSRWPLSPKELQILESFLRREDRRDFLARTGMALSTYKTHVRHLLVKADDESLASVAIDLFTLR